MDCLRIDFYRIWRRRLTDCLRIFTGCRGQDGLFTDFDGLFTDCLVADEMDEAYGLLTDFYRIWRKSIADCLWISIGFGGEGLRIVCECLPDVEDEAYGLFTDVYRM